MTAGNDPVVLWTILASGSGVAFPGVLRPFRALDGVPDAFILFTVVTVLARPSHNVHEAFLRKGYM